MPLLDYTDYERQTNTTLPTAERTLANTIADALLQWSARYCHRAGWAKTTYTEVFSPSEYGDQFYVSALPLDTTQAVSVSTYNSTSGLYDTYTGTIRKNAAGVITTADYQPYGYEAVKVTYTGGYTTLPDDLKQALTELLVQRFNDADSGGKVLTEVKAIDYTEKYELSGTTAVADPMEVLDSYRLPVVF